MRRAAVMTRRQRACVHASVRRVNGARSWWVMCEGCYLKFLPQPNAALAVERLHAAQLRASEREEYWTRQITDERMARTNAEQTTAKAIVDSNAKTREIETLRGEGLVKDGTIRELKVRLAFFDELLGAAINKAGRGI